MAYHNLHYDLLEIDWLFNVFLVKVLKKYILKGSKNPLSLDMGSVKTRIFSECSMLECNKDLELYYLDSFKIVHEK